MAALDPSSFGNLNLFGKCGENFSREGGVPFLKVKIRSDGPDPTRLMSSSDSD